jgi:hypothetical protein
MLSLTIPSDNTTDVQQARIPFFAQLYEKLDGCPDEEANYDLTVLGEARAERLNQSIANNPDMFLSPFGGIIVQGAAHSFVFQLFANRTAEHPNGILNRETLKSVCAMSTCADYHQGPAVVTSQHGVDLNIKKCDQSFVSAGKKGLKYKYVSQPYLFFWFSTYETSRNLATSGSQIIGASAQTTSQ